MFVNLDTYGNTRIHILYTYIHASMLLGITKILYRNILKHFSEKDFNIHSKKIWSACKTVHYV